MCAYDAPDFRSRHAKGNPAIIGEPMTISDLPALNASMNAISTVFISAGWWLVRRGHWRQHIACMLTAVLSSTAFLVGYLVYHAHVGEKSTHFTAHGIVRPIYFTILLTHILLAFTVLPL